MRVRIYSYTLVLCAMVLAASAHAAQYFSPYRDVAKARHDQRTHLSLHQADLVVQSGGHMRTLAGRADIPSLLPAGVTADRRR